MNYIGDFPEDFTTVAVYFTTYDGFGAPVAPLTAFEADDVKIYKNGSAVQKTTTNGLTMASPFDGIVGQHCLVIDTSNDTGDGGWWVPGATYSVLLNPDTETVNGQVPLKVIGTFTLAMSLRSTTNGRTLDVTATGAAGIDWGNLENLTTTNALTGTTIATTQVVASVTGAVGSVAGNVVGSVGSVTGLTASNLDATVSSRATPADIATALATTTYAEPTGAPAATATIVAKLGFVYEALRNKLTVTSSAKTFYNDAGASQWSKALSDDGSTFTESEGV